MGLKKYDVIQTADGNQYLALGDTMVFCLNNENSVNKDGIYGLRHLGLKDLEGSEIIGKLCYTECEKSNTSVLNMRDLVVLLSCTRKILDCGAVVLPYSESVVIDTVSRIELQLGEIGLTVGRE